MTAQDRIPQSHRNHGVAAETDGKYGTGHLLPAVPECGKGRLLAT